MSAADAIREQITQLEAQLSGLRMALAAVEGVSASTAAAKIASTPVAASARKPHPAKPAPTRQPAAGESSTTWQVALRQQCAIWRNAKKSGPKAEQDGTNGQLKYPDGRIHLVAVTNPNSWAKDTFQKINIDQLERNGFRVVDDNTFLVFPDA